MGCAFFKAELCRLSTANPGIEKGFREYQACFFILGNAEVSFVDFQRGALRLSEATPMSLESLFSNE